MRFALKQLLHDGPDRALLAVIHRDGDLAPEAIAAEGAVRLTEGLVQKPV